MVGNGRDFKLNIASTFCSSLFTKENRFQRFKDFLKWFDDKREYGDFMVSEIPLNKLEHWHFTENNEMLMHDSGKFFTIEGINVNTNFGKVQEWEQPIINQPEIGILGILTKVFDGVRYFLMQVKMEPGNINALQLSPTVQATKSNFSQVHKGKLPIYLEYFIKPDKSTVLIDQLQTEQGGRFLRKRNRNIVVETNNEIIIHDDFCWLTLCEIKRLLLTDNFVNMDARSVISTIPLLDDLVLKKIGGDNFSIQSKLSINNTEFTGINFDLIKSLADYGHALYTKDQLISWYTRQKINFNLIVKKIPLSDLKEWKITETNIFNDERHFSVIGVKVIAGTREVTKWMQPLIKDQNIGLLGFIIKKINGIIHFLIQAKVEPGNMDIIELSPTVSCSNLEYQVRFKDKRPAFFEFFINNSNSHVWFSTLQSEEGGRFYHLQNRNMIVEINETIELELPENFVWMTLNQMMDFMKYSMFNIEARSLVSCINFNF